MVNKIIGRLREQKVLEEAFRSDKAEFIAIYGRRRIGKTYLIHNYFAGRKCIYFQTVGTQNDSMAIQLQNFSNDLSKTFYNDEPIQAAKTWMEAFTRLAKALEAADKKLNNKIVVFFDELPWMATPRSRFLEALEYHWNRFWSNMPNVKLIICGSSASWIIKKIINNKGGLHNRVTRKMILKPFVLHETKKYLEHIGCRYNIEQTLKIYMTMGGVPFYLDSLKKRLSAMQNINDLCFHEEGVLFSEFRSLFGSLFNDADAYIEIIRVISKTRYGISRSDLEAKCKLSAKGGTFSDKLKGLEDAGFILSFLPFQHNRRGIFYKIIDEYSMFYMRWIEPELNTLLKIEPNNNFWDNKYKTVAWYDWAGAAFESVCYKHLDIIRKVLHIPNDSSASPWKYTSKNEQEDRAQIDLVFDRNDKVCTICEIKYTETSFSITKEYAKKLLKKEEAFIKKTGTKKQIFLALISANGLKDNMNSDGLINGLVTAEDFFDPKYIAVIQYV